VAHASEATVRERLNALTQASTRSWFLKNLACRLPEVFQDTAEMATKAPNTRQRRGYSADAANPERKRWLIGPKGRTVKSMHNNRVGRELVARHVVA
jgi:hypothetical protein